jgi:sulfite exporter TauE/SafE
VTSTSIAGSWSLATLWAVFAVGLAGGFGHCLGMCGPLLAASGLVSGASADAGTRVGARVRAVALWQAAYHAGRLLTYSCIGALLGTLGSLAAVRGVLGPLQRWVWLVAGVAMVVMGLAVAGAPWLRRLGGSLESGGGLASGAWFAKAFGVLRGRGPLAAFPLGMLNGLLPCGFLASIAISALAAGSPVLGAATLFAFGLGTVPALAGFGAASGLLGIQPRIWLLRLGGAIVVGLGVVYIVRAAGVLVSSVG